MFVSQGNIYLSFSNLLVYIHWTAYNYFVYFYLINRPMLFQTAEHISKNVAVGDVVTYSLVLQFLFSRAYPGLKPPYQVSFLT